MIFRGLAYFFTVSGLIFACFFLKIRVKKATPQAAILKSCISFCFIFTAVLCSVNSISKSAPYPLFIILALVCGFAGDIWLDLKYVQREFENAYTYAGLVFFLLGHIIYICSIIYKFYVPGNFLYLFLAALGFPAAALFIYFPSERVLKVKYGPFKLITALYSGALFSFFTFSLYLCILTGFALKALNLVLVSSILFMISDFILCGTYFGEKKVKQSDIIINHLTYFAAQFLMAYNLLFI